MASRVSAGTITSRAPPTNAGTISEIDASKPKPANFDTPSPGVIAK